MTKIDGSYSPVGQHKRHGARSTHGFSVRAALALLGVASMLGATRMQSNARLTEIRRIDATKADLVPIWWIGIDRSEALLVMQRQDQSFRYFLGDGTELKPLGGKGRGPGEFEDVRTAGWTTDHFWAYDHRLRRVTTYFVNRNPPGPPATRTLLFRASLADTSERISGDVAGVTPRQDLLIIGPRPNPLEKGEYTRAVMAATREGIVRRVLALAPTDSTAISLQGPTGLAQVIRPFASRPIVTVAPHGGRFAIVSVADSKTYVAIVIRYDGDTVFRRTYSANAQLVPERTKDSVYNAIESRLRLPEMRRALTADKRRRKSFFYPQVRHAFLDNVERLWVGLRKSEKETEWIIADTTGRPIMKLTEPASLTLRAANLNTVVGTHSTRDGLESIVMYRLASPQ